MLMGYQLLELGRLWNTPKMIITDNEFELSTFNFLEPVRVLLVVSPYYEVVCKNLVLGARNICDKSGVITEIVEVPGALEIPPAIRIAYRQSDYDGFVALGCVVRGETSHYETVCSDSAHGLMLLGIQGANIGNGILTVENIKQAEVRADPSKLNKGGGAAIAALSLISLQRKISKQEKSVGFRSRQMPFDSDNLKKDY